eukprot:scaffold23069_cov79-Attheya_sp.AAC.5
MLYLMEQFFYVIDATASSVAIRYSLYWNCQLGNDDKQEHVVFNRTDVTTSSVAIRYLYWNCQLGNDDKQEHVVFNGTGSKGW